MRARRARVMGPLAGRVALVTGAGRGLGRAVALALAAHGADVALLARTAAELERTAAGVRVLGRRALALCADVSAHDEVGAAAARAAAELGPVDVLINNAAIQGPVGPLVDNDHDGWAATVAVNLLGPLHCLQAVLPGMIRRRRGRIVNVSGGGATTPRPGFSAYAASKAALVRLTETVAAEVAPHGVRVNAMAPGELPTRMRAALGTGTAPPGEEALERAAALAVYLATDAAGELTGKLISAVHDPWWELGRRAGELNAQPRYTLRRIDPFTVGSAAG